MTDDIPYARPLLDDDDIAAVTEVLRSVWLTQGPWIAPFEEAVADIVGTRHVVAVSSGSAALHLAYAALDIGPGDEIVTSPVTFAATANMAALLGAQVRFADIDPDRLTLDPNAIEHAITSRTKAIVTVDFGGLPSAMDDVNAVAARHGIPVITDAAHSFGAAYKDQPIGAHARLTTLSFHAIKLTAAGEGGAVATDDDALADRVRRLRSHGIVAAEPYLETDIARDALPGTGAGTADQRGGAPWYYEVVEPGLNYRMTDLQCALGHSQLRKLPSFLARRRKIAQRYETSFEGHALIRRPPQPADAESAWHLYVIQLDLTAMTSTRREVLEAMRAQGIGAHVHYIPLHLQPYYRQCGGTGWGDLPHAEAYYRCALTLPLHPAMTDDDVDRVVSSVLGAVR